MTGKLNPQNAFMGGKVDLLILALVLLCKCLTHAFLVQLKIKGNMGLAMKLEAITKGQSKL